MLTENTVFELPISIKDHLQAFVDAITNSLPDKVIFKEMGLGNTNVEKVFRQLVKSFNLNDQ
jgi:hypothetical protein